MYYVVFCEDWCSTIPAVWLNMNNQTFQWPPKAMKITSAIRKGIPCTADWNNKTYKRVIGPFG